MWKLRFSNLREVEYMQIFHLERRDLEKSDFQLQFIHVNIDKELSSLVNWYHRCITIHYVSKLMNCRKAIVVVTGSGQCFHDYIYITLIFLLCVMDHLWPLILCSFTMLHLLRLYASKLLKSKCFSWFHWFSNFLSQAL